MKLGTPETVLSPTPAAAGCDSPGPGTRPMPTPSLGDSASSPASTSSAPTPTPQHAGLRIEQRHSDVKEVTKNASFVVLYNNTSVPHYTYNIYHLNPFTQHNISVSCMNEVGWSLPSSWIVAKTTEGAPSTAPQNITVITNGSYPLTVTWTQPLLSVQNGALLGYKVKLICNVNGNKNVSNIMNSNTTTLVIPTGSTNATCTVSVACFTVGGIGPYSQAVQVFIPSDGSLASATISTPESGQVSPYIILLGFICGLMIILLLIYGVVKFISKKKEIEFG
ncbi:hypothetical protein GDO78_018889 [Eleutherodactylus coqui]|uniref:Fibronectin type-III domain-containing protein n=1 Tax=Eleutherodactylus coqui TaxID=57060 RepID=A0A8J6BK36_ELECQ|nr:hypothetical protein GDO78_018889 [Eleutherodactylus coqui]